MSYTNSTTHYALPQWVGTDKPTWLGDMDEAFLKIDSGIYQALSSANVSNGKADNLANQIATLNETLVAHTTALNNISKTFKMTQQTLISDTSDGLIKRVYLLTNQDNTLFKIYGMYDFTTSNPINIPFPAGIFTDTYTISRACLYTIYNSMTDYSVVFQTNLNIAISPTQAGFVPNQYPSSGQRARIWLPPCLYINENIEVTS